MCGVFTLVAIIISLWLVNKHLAWYTSVRNLIRITRRERSLTFLSESRAAMYGIYLSSRDQMYLYTSALNTSRHRPHPLHGTHIRHRQLCVIHILGATTSPNLCLRPPLKSPLEYLNSAPPRTRLLRVHRPHRFLLPSPAIPESGREHPERCISKGELVSKWIIRTAL